MKLKWKLWLRVVTLFLILGIAATSPSLENTSNLEKPRNLVAQNDAALSRHRRFIGTSFSLDHLLTKMTNVMGFFGMNTSGMHQLQKIYNSAFSQNHLLFKRKILNLIMRTCHFILGYLPEEPPQPNNFFTTDYRLSYQTGKNQPENGDTNVVDPNPDSDITNIEFTNNGRSEIVTQKKLSVGSSSEDGSNSKIVYLDLKTDSETNVDGSNNVRKKRGLVVKNLVDDVLENAVLEAEVLQAEFSQKDSESQVSSDESEGRRKRSLHLNVNFASRYYNERSTTTTSTRAPVQIQKNVHFGFNWGGSNSYRQQHRHHAGEYHEDDYIDDDVFLRRRRQASMGEVDGITTEIPTTTSGTTETEEEGRTEVVETTAVETESEVVTDATTEVTKPQEDIMTDKDVGHEETEGILSENGISIEEITTPAMEIPEGEKKDETDKVLIQMGKKYFPAEIILTHTTKPNQGSEEKRDDDMGGDKDEKEEDPAHQLLYLVDDEKSGEIPQEIIVDDHVLSEVLNEMDRVTTGGTVVPSSSDVTTTEISEETTETITEIVSNVAGEEEVEEKYEVGELMQRLEILEHLVGIMSDMIDAQEDMRALESHRFEETGTNEGEEEGEEGETTTIRETPQNIAFEVTTSRLDVEEASTSVPSSTSEDETQESTTMLPLTTAEILITTTEASDVTVTTGEVQTTTVTETEENEEIVTTTEVGSTIPSETVNYDNVPSPEPESDLQSVISSITTTTTAPTTIEAPVSLVFPEGYSPEDVETLSKNLMHHRHLKHLAEGNHLNHLILKLAKDVNINDLDEIMDNIEQRLDNHEKKLMVLIRKKKMDNEEDREADRQKGWEHKNEESREDEDEIVKLFYEVKAQQEANDERLVRDTLNGSELLEDGKEEEEGKDEELVPLPISLLQRQEQAELVSGKRDERKRLFVSEVSDVKTSTTTVPPSMVSSTVRTNDRMKLFPRKRLQTQAKKTKPSDQMVVEGGEKMAAMQTVEMAAPSAIIENMKKFRMRMQAKNKPTRPEVIQMNQMMTEDKTPDEHLPMVQEAKPESGVMEEHVEDIMTMKKKKNGESLHHIPDRNMMSIRPHKMTTKPPHKTPTNMKKTPSKKQEDEDDDDDDYDIGLDDIVDYFVGDDSDEEETGYKHKGSTKGRSKRYLFDKFRSSLDNFRRVTNYEHFQDAFETDNEPNWQPPSYKIYPYPDHQAQNEEVRYVVYPSEYSAPYPARFVPESQPCDKGPWVKFEGLGKVGQDQKGFEVDRKVNQNEHYHGLLNLPKFGQTVFSYSAPVVEGTTPGTTEVVKEAVPEANIDLRKQTGDVQTFSLPSNIKVVQNKEKPNLSQIEFKLLPQFERGHSFKPNIQSQHNLHREITRIVEDTLKNNLWKLKSPEDFNTNFLATKVSKEKNKNEESYNNVELTNEHKDHVIFTHKNDQQGLSVSSAYPSQDLEDEDVRIIIRNEIDYRKDSTDKSSNNKKIDQKVSQNNSQTPHQEITNALADNLQEQLFKLKQPSEFSPLTQTYQYNPNEISSVGVQVVPFDGLQINKDANGEISQVVEHNVRGRLGNLKGHGEFNQGYHQGGSSQVNFDSEKRRKYEEITKAVEANVQGRFDRFKGHLDFQSGFGPNLAHQEITRVVEENLQKRIEGLKGFTDFQGLKTYPNSQNSQMVSSQVNFDSEKRKTYQEITKAVEDNVQGRFDRFKGHSDFQSGFGPNLALQEITRVVEENLQKRIEGLKGFTDFQGLKTYPNSQNSQMVSSQVNFDSEKRKTYQEITKAVEDNVQGRFGQLKGNFDFHSGFGPNLAHQEITKVVENNLQNKVHDLKSYTDFHAAALDQNGHRGQGQSFQQNFDSEKRKTYQSITKAVEDQLQNQLQNLREQLQINSYFVPNTAAKTEFGKTGKVEKVTEKVTTVSYNNEQQKTHQEITQAVEDSVQRHFHEIKSSSDFNAAFGPNLAHQEITKVVEDNLQQKLGGLKSHSDFQTSSNQVQTSQNKVNFDSEKQQTYQEITKALEAQLHNQLHNLKGNSNFLPVPLTRLELQQNVEKSPTTDIYDKEPFVSVVFNPNAPRVAESGNGPKGGLYLSTVYMPHGQTLPKITDQNKVVVNEVTTGAAAPASAITTQSTPVKLKLELVPNSDAKQTNLQIFEDSIKAVVGVLTNDVEGPEHQKLAKEEEIKEIKLPSRFGIDEEVSEFPPLIHQSQDQQSVLTSSVSQQPEERNFARAQIHNQNILLGSSPQDDGDVLIFSRFGGENDDTPVSTTLAPPTTSIQTTFVTSTSTVTEKFKQFRAFKPKNNIVVNYIYKQLSKEAHPKGFLSSGGSADLPSISAPTISSLPQIDLSRLEEKVPQGPRRGDIIESVEDIDGNEDSVDSRDANNHVQVGVASEDEEERRNVIINRIKEEQKAKRTKMLKDIAEQVDRLDGQIKHALENVFGVAEGDTDQDAILKAYSQSEFGKKIV